MKESRNGWNFHFGNAWQVANAFLFPMFIILICLKTYVAILGISAIQYWLSFRIKNFIAPVGIGLALIITSIILSQFDWKHIYKFPFAHPVLTLKTLMLPNRPFLENHELNSIGYCAFFLVLGYLDLKFRKERG
jgi:hypothetical protein